MIAKLAASGIPAHIINAICLTQNNQQTRIIGTNMEWIPILRGVRQGSPLGNDVQSVTQIPPRMFLDDLAFLLKYYHDTHRV